MHTSPSAPYDGAEPKRDEPRVRLVRGPPPTRTGDSAQVIMRQAQDRLRIAGGVHEIVVSQLFSAGLTLETALGLMGDHPVAGSVQEAINELDLVIRDFRTALFDHHQPDSPSGGRLG